jgi:hypothetical protein
MLETLAAADEVPADNGRGATFVLGVAGNARLVETGVQAFSPVDGPA